MRWPRRRPPPEQLSFDFEDLDRAAQARLVTNLSMRLAATEDPSAITTLVQLVRQHRDGWEVPPRGVPVTTLRLDFSDAAGQPLGNVGLGRSVLTAHQMGSFFSRPSDGELRRRVLELLGVEDPDG